MTAAISASTPINNGNHDAFSKSSSLNFLTWPPGSEPGTPGRVGALGNLGNCDPALFESGVTPCGLGTTGGRLELPLGGVGGKVVTVLTSFQSLVC